MKNKDWKRSIQQGKGKDIAKEFFPTFTTQEKVSENLYPNRKKKGKGKKGKINRVHYVEPIINKRCKEWESLNFFEKSHPIYFKDKLERTQKVYWKRMNFEPVYLYCKEVYKIEFTPEEKEIIDKRVGIEIMRDLVIRDYPNEDLITAIIKFYIKRFGIPNIEILDKGQRKLLELAEQHFEEEQKNVKEWEKIKAENKGKFELSAKKEPLVNVSRELYKHELEKLSTMHEERKISEEELKKLNKFSHLLLYVTSYKKNPDLISSINAKFKKALGII